MKSGLLAAVVVGAAVAGLILYYEKRLQVERKVLSEDGDDFHALSDDAEKMARPAHHAMG